MSIPDWHNWTIIFSVIIHPPITDKLVFSLSWSVSHMFAGDTWNRSQDTGMNAICIFCCICMPWIPTLFPELVVFSTNLLRIDHYPWSHNILVEDLVYCDISPGFFFYIQQWLAFRSWRYKKPAHGGSWQYSMSLFFAWNSGYLSSFASVIPAAAAAYSIQVLQISPSLPQAMPWSSDDFCLSLSA